MNKTLTGNGISVTFILSKGSQTAGTHQITVNVAQALIEGKKQLPLRFFTSQGTEVNLSVVQL